MLYYDREGVSSLLWNSCTYTYKLQAFICTLYSTCVMLCRKLVLGVLTDCANGVMFLIAEPQSQRPAGFETVSSLCCGSNFIWQVYITSSG